MNTSQPKHHTTALLLILLGVMIFATVVTYFYIKPAKTAVTTSPTPTKSIASKSSPTPTKSSDETANWKTYTNDQYGFSFKYPQDWPDATIQNIPAELQPFSYQLINFGNDRTKYFIRSVEISTINDYKGETYSDLASKIKNVYQTRSAAETNKLWMPPANAAIMAASTPQYIETSDKVFRGIYYFANIGQDRSTTLDSLIVLTDNQKIVQFHLAMKSDRAADFEKTITTDSGLNNFKKYVESLNTNSTETIVKEFNSIYKPIVLSLSGK